MHIYGIWENNTDDPLNREEMEMQMYRMVW